jgi:hypothetical protein
MQAAKPGFEWTPCHCGHVAKGNGTSTGYGSDDHGRTFCFECCASRDVGAMLKDGNSKRLPLYLTIEKQGDKVSNWPGTLVFPVRYRRAGRHNIAGTRADVRFVGPDRYLWHGVQLGEWTQIVHCRRTRERAEVER